MSKNLDVGMECFQSMLGVLQDEWLVAFCRMSYRLRVLTSELTISQVRISH